VQGVVWLDLAILVHNLCLGFLFAIYALVVASVLLMFVTHLSLQQRTQSVLQILGVAGEVGHQLRSLLSSYLVSPYPVVMLIVQDPVDVVALGDEGSFF